MSHAPNSHSQQADVFVPFGITGDLAKVMTFRSLYRLEAQGLLNCPIVGVAVNDWSIEQLREHARKCIEGTGERLDPAVFKRFAARLSYVQGDFGDASTYQRVGDAIKGKEEPVFYLEIPPFLFAAVVKGLSEAGLTEERRVVVEKPLGTTWPRLAALAEELHQYIDESQIYRIDHFLGKMGLEESLTCASPTRCWSRSGTGTIWKTCRSRWRRTSASRTRSFLRRRRRLRDVVRQPPHAGGLRAAMEPPAGTIRRRSRTPSSRSSAR